MTAIDVRAVLPRRSARTTTGGLQSPASRREAGEGVPALSPAPLHTLTRGWNPEQLPVLGGAGGWDVGAA